MTTAAFYVACSGWALGGTLIGAAAGCVPALHIYSLLPWLLAGAWLPAGALGQPELAVPLTLGLVLGWSVTNTIPAVLLSAPDESALYTVLPGQKLLLQGRGLEAVWLTTWGAGLGLAAVLATVPVLPRLLPPLHALLRPHYHWLLWAIIVFLLLSEWPKTRSAGPRGARLLVEAWYGPGAGLLTFALSGWLGFILLHRSPLPPSAAAQNLMPAFIGLFALPWLLLNLAGRTAVPPQSLAAPPRPAARDLLHGAGAGVLGGLFAAFVPVVTGGIGGLLAGHATQTRNDRVFLVAQGASKTVYAVGGLLLLLVPGLHVARGGAAHTLAALYPAGRAPREYAAAVAALAVGGAAALLLLPALARLYLRALGRVPPRAVSAAALAVSLGVCAAATGWRGLLIALPATGIGLLPVLLNSRRINCLGVILLPLACAMSGQGERVAGWLGLR
jgi:putative membrane protein